MKLTNLSLIIALVFACLLGIHNMKISEIENRRFVDSYYSRQLKNAAEDAASKLKKSISLNESGLFTEAEIRPEEIFSEFFKVLSYSLNLKTDEDRIHLQAHFPILAIIEDDGMVLSSIQSYEDKGYHYSERIIMPKIPFYFEDDGIIYYPKLSGEIELIYKEEDVWKKEYGTPAMLLSLPYRTKRLRFLEANDIDQKLRKIIAEQISDIISLELKRLIELTGNNREGYDFYLPPNTNEIASQIEEASLIAFMQGYRPGGGRDINIICKQRLDIKKSDFFVGFELSGVKYYSREGAPIPDNIEILEAFSNEIEAVKAGYYKYDY